MKKHFKRMIKDIKKVIPTESQPMMLDSGDTTIYYRYDIRIYFAKFKNGIYRQDTVTVITSVNSWAVAKEAAQTSIDLRMKNGRFHDWGVW